MTLLCVACSALHYVYHVVQLPYALRSVITEKMAGHQRDHAVYGKVQETKVGAASWSSRLVYNTLVTFFHRCSAISR